MDIELTENFEKKYCAKTEEQRQKVDKALGYLITNPRHPGLHTHRVEGTRGVWEAYVDESMRMTFNYAPNSLVLRNTCEHDAVLRRP